MASQRVLIIAVGGLLAERLWSEICRLSDARTTTSTNEWSADDWPTAAWTEIDALVDTLESSAFLPPILYRSDHFDCWSMGDIYHEALVKPHPDFSRQLMTSDREVIATRVRYTEQIILDENADQETTWLYNRINEAIAAWGDFAEDRLIILIRSPIGNLWMDEKILDSLRTVPEWWGRDRTSG